MYKHTNDDLRESASKTVLDEKLFKKPKIELENGDVESDEEGNQKGHIDAEGKALTVKEMIANVNKN